MKTDQNSNMQGTLNKRISMKKRRNAKRALLALNLVAVIFTTTVFSNPVSVLSEEVSTDTVQSIENSPGTDAQIAEQADVQQNTAEAAQAVEAPAAEAPAAENSAEAAKAEEPSGVNAPAENAMSAEMNAAEDGVVSTDDGASSASAVQSADTSSASNGSFEDAGAGNTDGTKDGIIENDAEGLNEAEGTAANEESEDAASQEQLTYEDEHVKISVSYTDGRAFTADSILTRTYLDSDEKNAVLSAVNAQISKGNSADTVSDTAENTESSGSAPVASTTATTVEYSVAGFHALMLAAKNQDGSDTTTEGDVTFSAEFKKGLNDAGYASREETTENNEAGGDGSLTTTTTRCETSWKIYTVTEKNLTDITDITDAHNTHYEMDENGTLKSASFRGALPQTVAFVQIVKKTVTETTTQKETEKATEKETQKVTEKYTEKITGKAAEKTTETETEKEDVKAEVPASAAMPAVAFDQKVTTENGTVMVHIDAEEGAFEEGTSMTVTPVTRHDILDKAIDAAGGKGAAAAMDITFTKADGTKTEPLKPIHVKMISPVLNHAEEAHVVHVADSGTIDVVARKSDGKTIESTSSEAASSDAKNAVSFESDSFSVYAIVYTVDFEYSVNGKMYQFSLPGGEKITLSDLVEVLGIIDDTNNGEKAAFNSVEDFLKEVANVQFSDESLVKVTPVEGDWELESLQPFTSDETLTITMKNGDVFQVIIKDAQYLTDISSLLTEATLKLNGEKITDGTALDVKENTQFELEVKFEETDDFQFSNDGTLTYKLPDGFVLPEGFEKNNITLDLGLDGKLYKNKLTYDPTTNTLTLALNKNDPNYSAFTASGTANIDLKVNGHFDYTQSSVEFSPDLTVTVTKKDPHDANVTKEGSYDKATKTMTYTVRVTADGTVSNLQVSDHMNGSSTALSYQNNSITIKSDERPGSAGARINPVTWTETADGFDAVIPDMVDGEVITFEYKATVDPSKVSQSGNATVDEMGNTVTIHNDTVDKEATHVYHNIEVSDISKNAVSVSDIIEEGDKKYQNVTWEIVTNDPPEASLAGSKITDTMTGSMVGNSVYNDDVKIYVYDSAGQLVGGDPRTPSLEDLGNSDPQNQKTWTYNVPTTDGNYKYVIRYSTKVDVTYVTGMQTAMNDVTGKGGSATGTAPVGQNIDHPGGGEEPDDGISVSKQTLHVSEEEVQWVIPISVDAKEGGYSSFVVTEEFPHKATGNAGFIDPLKITDENNLANNIIVTGLNPGETYEVEYLDPYTDGAYTNSGKNTIPRGIKITFKKPDGTDGLIADTDRILNIKLTTVNDQDWMQYALDHQSDPSWNKHVNSGNINDTHSFSYEAQPMKRVVEKRLHNNGYQNINYTYSGDSQPTSVPRYEFRISVGGVNNEPLVISDFMNTDHFMLYGDIEIGGSGNKTDVSGTKRWLVSGEDYIVTENGFEFSIDNLPKDNGSYYGYYILTYYMIPKSKADFEQIKLEAADNGGKADYTNTASLDEDNKSTVDFHYDYKILDKIAAAHDGYVTYTITINKDKMELNGGADMTLFDTYSKNQTIDFSTITVSQIDPAENRSRVSWDFSGYTGTFTIPDSTKVVITYNAKPVGETEQILTNEVYMNGYTDDSGETKVVSGSGEGGASSLRIRVYKYERGHMETGLNSTVFRLLDANKQPILNRAGEEITFATGEVYMYTQDVPEENAHFLELGIAGKKKDVIESNTTVISNLDNELQSKPWSNVFQYAKKVSGYTNILLDESATGVYLKKDTRYYLEEIQTATEDAEGNPASYKLPTFLYSFMISDHSDYDNYIYHNNDVMTARNDRDNGGLDIVKQWGGSAELTAEQKNKIYFLIEKKSGENFEPYTYHNTYPDGHIPYSALSDDALHLDKIEDGIYRVTECNAQVDEYNLVTTYTVDGGHTSSNVQEFEVTSADNDDTPKSHNVTIKNKYDVEGYEFTKVDSNTLVSLPGATFKVYKQADDSEVKTYTSGEDDGKFTIKWSDGGYEKNTLYYVKETEAPEGYTITEDKKFYFYFSDETAGGAAEALAAINSFEHSHDVVDLTTDGGRETVANEKGELTVTKEWKNQNGGTMSPGADSVTVTLKRYTMVDPVKTVSVTLTDANKTGSTTVANGGSVTVTWTDGWYSWNNSGSGPSTITVNGESVSNGSNNCAWSYSGSNCTLTISSVTENLEISLTGGGGSGELSFSTSGDGTASSGKVRSDDNGFSHEYSLTSSGDWSHTWTVSDAAGATPKVAGDIVLPKTDGNGNEYYYYVEETPVTDFTTSYVPATGGVKTGEIQVINTGEEEEPQTGKIIVKKTFKGITGDDLTALQNGLTITVTGKDVGGTGIDILELHWSDVQGEGKTIDNLPLSEKYQITESITGDDATTVLAKYEQVTTGTDASVTSFTNVEPTADGVTTELVNSYKPKTTDFEFSKIWNDIGNQPTAWPTGATITVTMNAYTDTSQKAIDDVQVTLSADGSAAGVTPAWTATTSAEGTVTTFKVEGLPKYKEGIELHYYVIETQVDSYKAPSYATSEGNGLVFTGSDVPKATNGQQIINTPEGGYELPSTGGPGTLPYTLGGIALIMASALMYRFRMRRRERRLN